MKKSTLALIIGTAAAAAVGYFVFAQKTKQEEALPSFYKEEVVETNAPVKPEKSEVGKLDKSGTAFTERGRKSIEALKKDPAYKGLF